MAEPCHEGEFRCILTHSTANKAVSRLHLFVSRQELKKPSARCHAMQLESALYTCSLKNPSVRLWAMRHYIMDRFVHLECGWPPAGLRFAEQSLAIASSGVSLAAECCGLGRIQPRCYLWLGRQPIRRAATRGTSTLVPFSHVSSRPRGLGHPSGQRNITANQSVQRVGPSFRVISMYSYVLGYHQSRARCAAAKHALRPRFASNLALKTWARKSPHIVSCSSREPGKMSNVKTPTLQISHR